MPARRKKKRILFPRFNVKIRQVNEKRLLLFFRTWGRTQQLEIRTLEGGTFCLTCHWRDTFTFPPISRHHYDITKSFACRLSRESCLCAQCQTRGCTKVVPGGTRAWSPNPWSFLIITWPGVAPPPSPRGWSHRRTFCLNIL